jgi:hypothetical protein
MKTVKTPNPKPRANKRRMESQLCMCPDGTSDGL